MDLIGHFQEVKLTFVTPRFIRVKPPLIWRQQKIWLIEIKLKDRLALSTMRFETIRHVIQNGAVLCNLTKTNRVTSSIEWLFYAYIVPSHMYGWRIYCVNILSPFFLNYRLSFSYKIHLTDQNQCYQLLNLYVYIVYFRGSALNRTASQPATK